MSRAIGPLASFDESTLRELAPRGATRSFPKNAVVINEGDQTDSLRQITVHKKLPSHW